MFKKPHPRPGHNRGCHGKCLTRGAQGMTMRKKTSAHSQCSSWAWAHSKAGTGGDGGSCPCLYCTCQFTESPFSFCFDTSRKQDEFKGVSDGQAGNWWWAGRGAFSWELIRYLRADKWGESDWVQWRLVGINYRGADLKSINFGSHKIIMHLCNLMARGCVCTQQLWNDFRGRATALCRSSGTYCDEDVRENTVVFPTFIFSRRTFSKNLFIFKETSWLLCIAYVCHKIKLYP